MFFDTEFTGLRKNTTLISLGIVSEDGRKFYAEFLDYDPKQCDKWIKENVISNLFLESLMYENNETLLDKWTREGYLVSAMPFTPPLMPIQFCWAKKMGETLYAKGDTSFVAFSLKEWLSQFDSVQFVSDVCHYDIVLLIDLFGTAFDLPENVSPVCHDISQDIAWHYGISDKEAFDKSREEIVSELCGHEIEGRKHNALYDAEVIKSIYEVMQGWMLWQRSIFSN